MPNWLKGLLVVIVAACLLVALVAWIASRQKSDDTSSTSPVVVSVDYDALKAKAEGTIAVKCRVLIVTHLVT
jgi:hypothetical protein